MNNDIKIVQTYVYASPLTLIFPGTPVVSHRLVKFTVFPDEYKIK